MAKGALKWFLYVAAACLTVLGVLFIMAAYAEAIRLVEGIVFIVVALIIAYLARERKPIEIRKTVTVTGPIKVKEIRCPNCGAILNPDKVQVIDGKPYMTCNYCGNKFEITEEPTW
jgi:DNA-directed RNA polymerase subunit RPC12/RpoP